MFLVMLETNGNQSYIFASPRLRESIGASYQLTLLGQWVKDAWALTAKAHWEAQHPDYGAEAPWVSRSSGKVILMVDTEEQAKALIGEVTRRVLVEAPGMDVSGVYVQMLGRGPDEDDAGMGSSAGANSSADRVDASHVTEDDLKRIHAEAGRYAVNRPPAAARFAQMPFLARAQDSILPAAPPLGRSDEAGDDTRTPYSLPSRTKRHLAHTSRESLLSLVREAGARYEQDDKLAGNVTELEKLLQGEDEALALSKIAVIHIDGNGVGAIMRDLGRAMKQVPEATFLTEIGCRPTDLDALRRFILEVNVRLEHAVKKAYVKAWKDVADWARVERNDPEGKKTPIPVVPVIVGGDDVTVITSGEYALPFAAAYLGHYEDATYADDVLAYLDQVGSRPTSHGPMTAAAGVAVVGHNFPFHIAYDLAEDLVRRAKKVGKSREPHESTLDYHALFDTTVLDPKAILDAYTSFTARPFRFLPHEPGVSADPPPSGSDPAVSRYESWRTTCERVAWFMGMMPAPKDVKPTRFPKSRAARIRKLLSDAAKVEVSSRADAATRTEELRGQACNEWCEAAKDLRKYIDIDDRLGGPEALFDLLELAELLPDSYLRTVLNLPAGTDAATTTIPEEAQA